MQRRNFFRSIALGGVSAALSPIVKAAPLAHTAKEKPATNVKDALAIPRNQHSMPGRYPGKVARATHPGCIVDGQPSEEITYWDAEEMYGSSSPDRTTCGKPGCNSSPPTM